MASKDPYEDSPSIDDFSNFDDERRKPIEIPSQPEFYRIPKKFGNIPVVEEPIGYEKRKGYEGKFPFINLPIQKMEEISFGNNEIYPKNKLFWGDNLHIMRTMPSESIDLIYIDPPFFSGRQYNVVFGDQNEIRSFNDIWDGGMITYLTWLNARLLEMKRLLRKTGVIYIHLDWHASHYVKIEMDKIFGYNNFVNEIVWKYESGGRATHTFSKKHDAILVYSKTGDFELNLEAVSQPRSSVRKNHMKKNVDADGTIYYTIKSNGKIYKYYEDELVPPSDVWDDISHLQQKDPERIGYPTQKPEKLLERIIKSSSKEGGVVADFFSGGGTTASVAQKHNRKWIACDISRIAVEVTKGRIMSSIKMNEETQFSPDKTPNLETFSWGFYDISKLSELSEDEFKDFIVKAYGARKANDKIISGTKNGFPVWVGSKDTDSFVTEDDVLNLAQYLGTYSDRKKKGIMVAWQFSDGARRTQEMLAEMGEGIDFITIDMVTIGSDNFRSHIVEKNQEYSSFLRFILPPLARLRINRISHLMYQFDFSESVSLNDGKIINIQADFEFDGVFTPSTGYYFSPKNKEENELVISYGFEGPGIRKVAFRIEDDQGGDTILIREIEVK